MEHIKVTVITDSSTESVKEKKKGEYIVKVCAKPERGEANKRAIALLRRRFGPGNALRIVSGHHSPHKIISVS